MLPAIEICKKCNQSKIGEKHQFHYGIRTSQSSTKSGNITTTTTTYSILGSEWIHICGDCMKKMVLSHGLGWLIFGVVLALAGFGFDRLISGTHPIYPYTFICGITGFIVVISNLVFLLKSGNENFKQRMAIKLRRKEIRATTRADSFWTTKEFAKLNIRRF